jgi:hypothetical protein
VRAVVGRSQRHRETPPGSPAFAGTPNGQTSAGRRRAPRGRGVRGRRGARVKAAARVSGAPGYGALDVGEHRPGLTDADVSGSHVSANAGGSCALARTRTAQRPPKAHAHGPTLASLTPRDSARTSAARASGVPTARGRIRPLLPTGRLASGSLTGSGSALARASMTNRSRGSDAWADAVRVVVRRSCGRSACGRTPGDRAAFALTLRVSEDDRTAGGRLASQARSMPRRRHVPGEPRWSMRVAAPRRCGRSTSRAPLRTRGAPRSWRPTR